VHRAWTRKVILFSVFILFYGGISLSSLRSLIPGRPENKRAAKEAISSLKIHKQFHKERKRQRSYVSILKDTFPTIRIYFYFLTFILPFLFCASNEIMFREHREMEVRRYKEHKVPKPMLGIRERRNFWK
jgi:hypothetical protein